LKGKVLGVVENVFETVCYVVFVFGDNAMMVKKLGEKLRRYIYFKKKLFKRGI